MTRTPCQASVGAGAAAAFVIGGEHILTSQDDGIAIKAWFSTNVVASTCVRVHGAAQKKPRPPRGKARGRGVQMNDFVAPPVMGRSAARSVPGSRRRRG